LKPTEENGVTNVRNNFKKEFSISLRTLPIMEAILNTLDIKK